MTLDLDMVTEAAAQEPLVAFMESQGFVTLHRSSGYSNHRHADRSSPGSAETDAIDLQRDVPTTPEDVDMLRRLRRETPSWFSLSLAEFEALIPKEALERHPVTRLGARPFTLP